MSDPESSPRPAPKTTVHARGELAALLEDQCDRWDRGERVFVETYLQLHPALHDDADTSLDLIYQEVLLRERRGENPRLEEYRQRFPQFAEELGLQFEVHRATGAGDASDGATPDGNRGTAGDELPEPRGEWPAIPGYVILSELGRGGMGVVYRAWQENLRRLVAIKVVPARGRTGRHDVARFRTEAEAVARLEHPNIVQIYEVGEADGCPYIVLQFVDGGDLAQKLSGTPMPVRQAAAMVETLARAIHSAHQSGIIHRDLTPSNVLLTAAEIPKITDFGLAKILVGGVDQTQSGDILGTPSYMAPEQAGGKIRESGPATDVYALGAILYEMLTGRPPFRAATLLETLELVRSQEPVPPARLQPRLPRDLETACLKCLRKEPYKRYASAEALADDLGRFLADRPVLARRTSLAEYTVRWCRRNPAQAGLLGSVALLLVIIAVGSSLAAFVLERKTSDLTTALDAEQRANEHRDKLWDAYLAQNRAIRSGPQIGQRHRSLKVLAEAAALRPSLELRNDAIAVMTLTDLRSIKDRRLPLGVTWTSTTADPRLERYAAGDSTGHVSVWNVADDQIVDRWSELRQPAWAPRFSRDGRYLAAKFHPIGSESPNELLVRDLVNQKTILRTPAGVREEAFQFSWDNRWLAVGDQAGEIILHDLTAADQPKRIARVPEPRCLAFDPSGRWLAVFGERTSAVHVLDLHGKTEGLSWPCPARVNQLAWHPGGKKLAGVCGRLAHEEQYPVYVWDAAHGSEPLVLRGHDAEVRYVTFSHGGDLLATTSWDETLRLWDPWTGKQLLSAPGGPSPQFSPDDRSLGVTDKGIQVWELTAGRECGVMRGHTDYKGPWSVDYSPDGRLLVTAGSDGVRFWNAASAREIPDGFQKGKNPRSALFDPKTGRDLHVAHGTGLDRWPITPGGPRVGPVEHLVRLVPLNEGLENRAGVTADGRTLALSDFDRGRAYVVDLTTPLVPKALPGHHPGIAEIAISPDGRWVAASSRLRGVRVWKWDRQAGTGEVAKDFPTPSGAVTFSPDGEWLVIATTDDYSFWKGGSWEPGLVIPSGSKLISPPAFSPRGDMLAVSHNNRSVRLLDPATGLELATLTAPDPGVITCLRFSPDAGQLAVATAGQTIQLWDLGLIRKQLRDMQLDW